MKIIQTQQMNENVAAKQNVLQKWQKKKCSFKKKNNKERGKRRREDEK